MLKNIAIFAICSLPSLAHAEDAKWVCMKHSKEVKTKGEEVKDRETDCVVCFFLIARQPLPILKVDLAFDDCFDLPHQHPDLRHRVFNVGGDRLTIRTQCHELMARARIRAVKTQGASLRMKSRRLNKPLNFGNKRVHHSTV